MTMKNPMRVAELFRPNRTEPRFIPFIMAGHPNLQATFDCIVTLERLGADAIEIGIPFSDPIADGPINQQAAAQALEQGVNAESCLSLIQRLRAEGHSIPLILFSYYNPLLSYGLSNLAKKAQQVGVDSLLVVDLPLEEAKEWHTLLRQHHLGIILLASPTTTQARLGAYSEYDPDFIYYVSRLGVTGVQQRLSDTLAQEIGAIRRHIALPICIGFGISTPEQAHAAAQLGDGVIVGSALVKTLQDTYAHQGLTEFEKQANQFRRAISRKMRGI